MPLFKKSLPLLLILTLGAAVPFCGAMPLPEKKHHQLIQNYFEDGLLYSAYEEAQAYLKSFPTGEFRENILFLKIRAEELQAEGNKKLSKILKDYQQYRQTYPKGQWLEEALFAEGVLSIRLEKYGQGLVLLEELLQKFPQSPRHEETLYWMGEAAFYSAKRARENRIWKPHNATRNKPSICS